MHTFFNINIHCSLTIGLHMWEYALVYVYIALWSGTGETNIK